VCVCVCVSAAPSQQIGWEEHFVTAEF